MINFVTFRNNAIRQANTKALLNYNFVQRHSSLAPLPFDSVSFTSAASQNAENTKTSPIPMDDDSAKILNAALMNAIDNKKVCEEVYENAKFAKEYLRRLLNKNLEKLTIKTGGEKGCIASIDTRIKNPRSIREKIACKINSSMLSSQPKLSAFNPKNPEEIKAHCRDLIGARIVMTNDDKKECAKILDALLKDIESGKLKVTKIEHYIAETEKGAEQYFDPKDLKRFQDSVNKQRQSRGLEPIQVETKMKPSGYMALHLDVDLSSSNFKVKENGYLGEIQFIGQEVAQFKEVEDLCYKLNSGKEIKSESYIYAPFSTYFKTQMSNPNFPNLKQDFEIYTKEAYLFQKKKKSAITQKDKNKAQLPSIEECGMTGKIPPGLDFRVLSRIKANCDSNYKIIEQYPVQI